MNRHKLYVAMSATMVAFFVWVNPVRGDPVYECCVEDPPSCCVRADNCSGCGLTTCQDCDAHMMRRDQSCGVFRPCCIDPPGECFYIAADCCEALGYRVVTRCSEECGPQPPGKPAGGNAVDLDGNDGAEEAETSEDQASPSPLWVLVVAALLLLPAVPLVMRRRAARQE